MKDRVARHVVNRTLVQWLWLGLGGISGAISGLVTTGIMAHSLRVTEFGELALAQAIAAMVVQIGRMGLVTWGERELARSPHIEVVRTVVRIRLCITVFLFACSLVAVHRLDGSATNVYLAVVVGGIATSGAADWALVVIGEARWTTTLRMCRGVLLVFLMGIWVVWVRSVAGAAAVIASGDAGFAIMSYCVFVRQCGNACDARQYAPRDVVKESWPFAVVHLVGLLRNADVLAMQFFGGSVMVAVYTLAQKFASPLNLLSSTLLNAVAPQMNRAGATDPSRVIAAVRAWSAVAICGGAVLVSSYALLLHTLIRLVGGDRYVGAFPTGLVLCVWAVLATVAWLSALGLSASGRERELPRIYVVGGLLCAGTVVTLVRTVGAVGGALGLVAGEVVVIATFAWKWRVQSPRDAKVVLP